LPDARGNRRSEQIWPIANCQWPTAFFAGFSVTFPFFIALLTGELTQSPQRNQDWLLLLCDLCIAFFPTSGETSSRPNLAAKNFFCLCLLFLFLFLLSRAKRGNPIVPLLLICPEPSEGTLSPPIIMELIAKSAASDFPDHPITRFFLVSQMLPDSNPPANLFSHSASL
jgi:hypothetical protein